MMLSASPSGLAGGDGGALADGGDIVGYSGASSDVVVFHCLGGVVACFSMVFVRSCSLRCPSFISFSFLLLYLVRSLHSQIYK